MHSCGSGAGMPQRRHASSWHARAKQRPLLLQAPILLSACAVCRVSLRCVQAQLSSARAELAELRDKFEGLRCGPLFAVCSI